MSKNLEQEITEIIANNLPIKVVRDETVSPRTHVTITENEHIGHVEYGPLTHTGEEVASVIRAYLEAYKQGDMK